MPRTIRLLKDAESASPLVFPGMQDSVVEVIGEVKSLYIDGRPVFDETNKVVQGASKLIIKEEHTGQNNFLWTSGIDTCIGFIIKGSFPQAGKDFFVLYHHEAETQETLIQDFMLKTLG